MGFWFRYFLINTNGIENGTVADGSCGGLIFARANNGTTCLPINVIQTIGRLVVLVRQSLKIIRLKIQVMSYDLSGLFRQKPNT